MNTTQPFLPGGICIIPLQQKKNNIMAIQSEIIQLYVDFKMK